jgi:hypothetical protein
MKIQELAHGFFPICDSIDHRQFDGAMLQAQCLLIYYSRLRLKKPHIFNNLIAVSL